MNVSTLMAKTSVAQVCLADLRERGIDHLVESVKIDRLNKLPIVKLRQGPPLENGVRIIRHAQHDGSRLTIAAHHLGCQLRWEVRS